MGPHAMPVGIKTWGQDDIMFKSTKIFHLFDKISGNSGRHFLQPSQPIDFQSILIYAYMCFPIVEKVNLELPPRYGQEEDCASLVWIGERPEYRGIGVHPHQEPVFKYNLATLFMYFKFIIC